MEAVLERILQISFSGSVIVLTVLVLRLVLRNAPRRMVCLLWMLAVLRLLVPFEIESRWSLQPEPVTILPPAQEETYFDSGTAPAPVTPEFLEDAVEYPLQRPVPEPGTEPIAVLPWVWLVGTTVLAAHGILSFRRLRCRVREAVILEEGVWICPGLDTAFVLGFFRPRVYLPVLPEAERALVLLHERQHIRRGDHWWKLAAYAAVSLHWFNPLAWVTYILMCRDMELACDQETVRGMDNTMRKAYSAALLNCAAKRSGIAACPVAFGEISVKERIKMVLNYKKPGFWVTVIALLAALAVGIFLLTSPKELTDLERCEQALKQWQGMENIQLHISTVNEGDYALNSWSEVDYWASGANAMKREILDTEGDQTIWDILWDGIQYRKFTWEENGEAAEIPWEENTDDVPWHLPWILTLDWDVWEITHLGTEETEKGRDVFLEAYRPGDDAYSMVFSFEGQALKQIRRTFSEVLVEEREKDGILASSSTQTFTLEETDRDDIEKQIQVVGGFVPELVWLYRELEALQASGSVHLVIDMEIDSNYDGWDTCRQEFLKSDRIWFRNFDYQSSAGPFTTSYLWYGAKLYATEHSDAGAVPNRPWEQIEDRGFGEINLLTRNWREFEVLDIQRKENGSAVITLQGDLTPTGDTTYHSKTYEFHLDPKGKLTTHICNYHASKYIREQGTQGTFEFRGKDTVHILNTPFQEIRARILEAVVEVKEAQSAAAKSGDSGNW